MAGAAGFPLKKLVSATFAAICKRAAEIQMECRHGEGCSNYSNRGPCDARAFYVDRLGFDVAFDISEDGHSGLLGIKRGTIEITLDCPMSGHGRNACVALQVDDADFYYNEWRSKVDLLRAPKDEEWGARTFDLLDPSGNTLFIMGPKSKK